MGTATIRQVIRDARASEARDPTLHDHLAERLTDLQQRLLLPAEDPLGALENFSRRYIDHVPDFLDLLREQAGEACGQIDALLNMAEDFFLAPPEAIGETAGLLALMDEAFLAQRLIEEVNDRFIRSHGSPLVHVDMTRANIIAHHLVGEPLASRLETLVGQGVELVASRSGLFETLRDTPARPQQALLELPCMSREVAVDLRLESSLEGAPTGNREA